VAVDRVQKEISKQEEENQNLQVCSGEQSEHSCYGGLRGRCAVEPRSLVGTGETSLVRRCPYRSP
jgi:hypothetical protein